ncbi:MAG: ankyrin repeat domain-containing protein [Betaproteobacteria bacterium]|nr:ankyrin repeat domain-containing protein [Betaproteobacteria bacterium]
MRSLIVAVACGALVALPAFAQSPPDEPNVLESIGGAVRGLLNSIFGTEPARQGQAAPPEAAKPPAAVEQPAPAAPQAQSPQQAPGPRQGAASIPPAAFKGTPLARTSDAGLGAAIANSDFESAQKMIERGADIEAKDSGAGASPLHFAVMKGNRPIIELLVARGADVNSRTRNGTTPLHTAVLYARLEVAEFLIGKGANVNAESVSGATPLALAIAAKNEPIAARLKALGGR